MDTTLIIMLMKYMVVKMMVMVVYNCVEIVTVATTMIITMMTHMMVKMMVMVVDR